MISSLQQLFSLCFISLCFAGCVSEDTEPLNRTPLGAKADHLSLGSCDNACGGQSDEGCWCDESCESYGDCCADKALVCDADDPPPISPCEGLVCGDTCELPGGIAGNCTNAGTCSLPFPVCDTDAPPPISSCEGACGGQSDDSCWCDDGCESYGDCCADKALVCDADEPPPISSCEGLVCGDTCELPGGIAGTCTDAATCSLAFPICE